MSLLVIFDATYIEIFGGGVVLLVHSQIELLIIASMSAISQSK